MDVKVGIIGCGKMGDRHLRAYRQLGLSEVVICDVDRSLAEQRAQQHGYRVSLSIDALFEDESIQAIDVCTPTPSHKEFVVRALELDKYVFCEKPLCLTLDEAQEIQHVEATSLGRVMVGYVYRFFPAMAFVKQVLNEGIIGTPYMAIFRLGGRGSHAPWKHTQRMGGGALLEMAVHNLDMVNWLMGEPHLAECYRNVTLLPSRTIRGQAIVADAEDFVLVRLEAGGAEVLCQADLITPSFMNYLEIHGDNGSVFTSILDFMPTMVFVRESRNSYEQGQHFRTFAKINAHQAELGHFLQVVRGQAEVLSSVEKSLCIMRVIDAIRMASGVDSAAKAT